MASHFTEIAASGPLLVAVAVAVAALAGLVSFFAPCMLPLVPGYLSYVTGLAGIDLTPVTTTGGSVPENPPRVRRWSGRAVAGASL